MKYTDFHFICIFHEKSFKSAKVHSFQILTKFVRFTRSHKFKSAWNTLFYICKISNENYKLVILTNSIVLIVEWNIWEIRTKKTNRRIVILHRSRIPDSWNHSCANAMRASVVTRVRRHWTFFYRKVTW